MKTLKAMAVALMGAFLLLPCAAANGQDIQHDASAFQLKSPQKAQAISALCTIGPVAAGALWWALDGSDDFVDYDLSDRRWAFTSPRSPDRTAPVMLIMSGVVVGPSVGYFYGDCDQRGALGLMIRMGVGGLTMIAASKAASRGSGDAFSFDGLAAGLAVTAVGVGVITIHALYDIGKVQSTVENRNWKLMRQHEQTSVKLFPRYFADSGAGGLQLQVTF